jgi:histidinol-phosphatase (PHP family)
MLGYRDLIEPVLEILARKELALEINTRGTYDWQGRVGPEDRVLTRFREFGGKYVTIGSDSHVTKYVGAGFAEAAAALKRTGFDSFTIYRNRQPVQIPLK